MHRALSCRWLSRTLRTGEALPASGVPLFLCPTAGLPRQLQLAPARLPRHIHQCRLNHVTASPVLEPKNTTDKPDEVQKKLPVTCSGCGAFTQTTDSQQLGYYDLTAKRVRTWLKPPKKNELQEKDIEANQVISSVLESMDKSQLTALGFTSDTLVVEESPRELPSCT